jgi:hypothetical protein
MIQLVLLPAEGLIWPGRCPDFNSLTIGFNSLLYKKGGMACTDSDLIINMEIEKG